MHGRGLRPLRESLAKVVVERLCTLCGTLQADGGAWEGWPECMVCSATPVRNAAPALLRLGANAAL
jgi:hypothetical protein